MQISSESALRIVNEISGIIGHDVNMMDSGGVIIASTNPSRIGTFHAGAKKLLEDRLERLIISADNEYKGSRKGLNLPLVFENSTVGVIGVTGELEEIEKFSQIIKKMTEILLLDSWVKSQKRFRAEALNQFVENWLFNSLASLDEKFRERGLQLGVDILIPRRVMAVAVSRKELPDNSSDDALLMENFENTVSKIVRQIEDTVYYRSAYKLICLLPSQSDKQLHSLAEQISVSVEQSCSLKPSIGVDDGPEDYRNLLQSCAKADKALKAALDTGHGAIRFYGDVHLEIFINEIPRALKEEFISKVFRDFDKNELRGVLAFLKVYFECSGSVTQVAERLFLHKNTVQYKLKKISERTFHDPRKLEDSALFYLALKFSQNIGESPEHSRMVRIAD